MPRNRALRGYDVGDRAHRDAVAAALEIEDPRRQRARFRELGRAADEAAGASVRARYGRVRAPAPPTARSSAAPRRG